MENKDISKIAIESIKQGGIKPRPKSGFLLKRVSVWFFALFSVLIGSASFSVSLHLLFDNDLDTVRHLGINMALRSLPYFWFLFLAVFVVVGEYYYRKTAFGYRYRTALITAIYMMITIAAGSAGYAAGIGSGIENAISRNMPFYQKYLYNKESVWIQPEQGLLAGEIKSVDGQSMELMDFRNNLWKVDLKDASVKGRAIISAGQIVKLIGKKTGIGLFTASEIRPWQGCGGQQQGIKGMCGKMMR